MRRKPNPPPLEPADVERPCGFRWFLGDGDCECDRHYRHTHGCNCGKPDYQHERFIQLRRKMAAEEARTEVTRKHLNRARANPNQVNQRAWPLRTNVIAENGQRRRYQLDGETIDFDLGE
jgi:hypothetical protein